MVVAVSGNGAFNQGVATIGSPPHGAQEHRRPTGDLTATLDLIGPRLRRTRELRGLKLTEVAEQAGMSKSTLSRLETGQRRPSLELLLPLARLYQVPLDELVGAPEVGDPRIRLKPRQVNGRTERQHSPARHQILSLGVGLRQDSNSPIVVAVAVRVPFCRRAARRRPLRSETPACPVR